MRNQKTEFVLNKIIDRLKEKKAEEIVLIYIGKVSPIVDYFLIATGHTKIHLDTLRDEVEEVSEINGYTKRGWNPESESGWVLIDYGDFIVHLFNKETRNYYELERIWGEGEFLIDERGRNEE